MKCLKSFFFFGVCVLFFGFWTSHSAFAKDYTASDQTGVGDNCNNTLTASTTGTFWPQDGELVSITQYWKTVGASNWGNWGAMMIKARNNTTGIETIYYSDNALITTADEVGDPFAPFTFSFASTSLDLSENKITRIDFQTSCAEGTGLYYQNGNPDTTVGTMTGSSYLAYFILTTNEQSNSSTYRGTGNWTEQDPSENWVIFSDPPFTNGMDTPDFKNWMTCINIVNGGAGSGYGYDVQIDYGTSTPSGYHDSIHDNLGAYAPLGSLPEFECPVITKSATSSPGTYQAVASLYVHYPISGDHFLASSSVFSFSIATGTIVDYPNQVPLMPNITCSFTISNTGVSAVDDTVNGVINGACKVLSYLTIPQQSSLNRFHDLWSGIEDKPPLGYFTQSKNAWNNYANSTSSQAVSLEGVSSISIFSTLKTALAWLIWLVFGLWIFHRLRKFNWHL